MANPSDAPDDTPTATAAPGTTVDAGARWGRGYCAVCGKAIAHGLLMCRYHWHRVGERTRRQVYGALDAWSIGRVELAQLRAAQARAVAEAR